MTMSSAVIRNWPLQYYSIESLTWTRKLSIQLNLAQVARN